MSAPAKKSSFSLGAFLKSQDEDGNDVYCGGKSSSSWKKLLVFYALFYTFLTAFWAMCFMVMLDSQPGWDAGPRFDNINNENDYENVYFNSLHARLSGDGNRDLSYDPSGTHANAGTSWTVNTVSRDALVAKGLSLKEAAVRSSSFVQYFEESDQSIRFEADDGDDAPSNVNIMAHAAQFCGNNIVPEQEFPPYEDPTWKWGHDTNRPCLFLQLNRIRDRVLESPANANAAEVKKVKEATNGMGNFLPVECFVASEATVPYEDRAVQFEVRSFLMKNIEGAPVRENTVADYVSGFQFMDFASSGARYYRDPTVLVRMKSLAPNPGNSEARNAAITAMFGGDLDDTSTIELKNVECTVKTSEHNLLQRIATTIYKRRGN